MAWYLIVARQDEMFQFRMDAQRKDRLEQLAAWDGVSMSQAVRDAIDEAWERRLALKLAMEKKPRL